MFLNIIPRNQVCAISSKTSAFVKEDASFSLLNNRFSLHFSDVYGKIVGGSHSLNKLLLKDTKNGNEPNSI